MRNGSDILVLINTGTPSVPSYTVMASQRDVTFDEATEEIDVSSKDARHKRVLPGRYSCNMSFDSLWVPTDAAYQALKAAQRDGELILIARQEYGVVIETADALITGMSEGFPDQAEATISMSLVVDGMWAEVGS